MREFERMIAGEPYDPADAELVAKRLRARELCRSFRALAPADGAGRRAVLEQLFARLGEHVEIEPPFFCDYGENIALGERVFVNTGCVVLDVCRVTVGSHTLLGPGVQLLTALHPLDAVARRGREHGAPVAIGDDVWIGAGALVLPGVSVGARSVIGAGSVVTRDVPSDVLAFGNPCRVVRRLA